MLFRPCTWSRLALVQELSHHTGQRFNCPLCLHSSDMVSYSVSITDADAEASTVLRRSRLAGLDRVPVPFEERIVQAWQRGAPEQGIDVDTLQQLVGVRSVALLWHACCCPRALRLRESRGMNRPTNLPKSLLSSTFRRTGLVAVWDKYTAAIRNARECTVTHSCA